MLGLPEKRITATVKGAASTPHWNSCALILKLRHGVVRFSVGVDTTLGGAKTLNATPHKTHVFVCTKGGSKAEISVGTHNFRYVSKPGRVFVFPAGCGEIRTRFFEATQRICVIELDDSHLNKFLPGRECARQLAPQVCIEDPHVARLLLNMQLEVREGCPGGPLYGQSLSVALIARLWGCYGVTAARGRSSFPQLDHIDRGVAFRVHSRPPL